MNTDFLLYFLYLIISLVIIDFIGKIGLLIINVKAVKIYYRIFLELVSGITIIVFLYSVITTHFKTVNILFLVLFLYYFFLVDPNRFRLPGKKTLINSFRTFHKDVLIIILAALPFFCYELFFLYSSSGYKVPIDDSFFYSSVSDALNCYGRENIYLSLNGLFSEQFKDITPYHYFELWTNAFFSKLFHLPSIFSLLLIMYPLFNAAVFIGLVAFWESFYRVSILPLLVILLLLFTDGVHLPFYDNFSFLTGYHAPLQSSLFSILGKKYSAVYMFIVLFLILFIKGKKKAAFISISSLLIISIGLFPGVLGGVLIYLFTNFFHKTFSSKDNMILLLFYTIVPFCFYFLYLSFGASGSTNDYVLKSNFLSILLSDIFNINHYKYLFGMTAYRLSRTLILYMPFIIFSIIIFKSVIKRNKELSQIIFLVLLFNFTGLFAYGMAIGLTNAQQLFTNTYTFTSILFIFVVLYGFAIFIELKRSIKKLFLSLSFVAILLFLCFNVYYMVTGCSSYYSLRFSDKFIDNVLNETKNDSYLIGACLFSNQNYEGDEFDWLYTKKTGYATNFSYGYKAMVNINAFLAFDRIEEVSSTNRYYIENSELYLFINAQKDSGSFESYEQSQVDFIDKYKIKYVFANRGATMSDLLAERVKSKTVDAISGEQFYVLK